MILLLNRFRFPVACIAALSLASAAHGEGSAKVSPDVQRLFDELRSENQALRAKQEQLQRQLDSFAKKQATSTSGKAGAKSDKTGAAEAGAKTKPKESGVAENALEKRLDQLKPANAEAPTLKEVSDAFDVPDSPAAGVLGVSPSKVQHLKTPKQLIPSVINGLDEHGHFQSGLALDFAPYQWLRGGQPVTKFRGGSGWDPSQDSVAYLERVLLRTQLSFATAKGTSDADKSSKIAFGIHSVLMNADDPLVTADAYRTGDGAIRQFDSDPAAEFNAKPLDARGQSLNHWVLGEREMEREKALPYDGGSFLATMGNYFWSHASWSVGAAPVWVSRDEKSSSYDYAGTTVWSSFAYVPSRRQSFRLLLDAIYREGEEISAADALPLSAKPAATPATGTAGGATKTAKTEVVTQESLFVIGGVRVGTRDFNATATGAYLTLDQSGGRGSDSAFRYGLAVEKRVSINSYLTLSVSKDFGHKDGENPVLVLGGFKFGLGGRDFEVGEQKKRATEHQDL